MGGFSPPKFAKADNPTAHHSNFWTRLATFIFLPVFNWTLLLYPQRLSYDWSMEAIPRIQRFSDPRNLMSLGFYFLLIRRIILSIQALYKSTKEVDRPSPLALNKSHVISRSCCNVCWCSVVNHQCSSNNNSIICAPTIDELLGMKNGSLENSGTFHHYSSSHSSRASNNKTSFNSSAQFKYHSNPPAKWSSTLSSMVRNRLSLSSSYSSCFYTPPASNACSPSSVSSTSSCSSSASSTCSLPSFRTVTPSAAVVEHGAILLQLAFLIWPFMPATNLFFYVGFVVAERVLYMPSVGFCLLAGHGCLHLWNRLERYQNGGPRLRNLLFCLFTCSVFFLSMRTIRRNEDWRDEAELYKTGVEVNPPKSWGNLGTILNSQGRTSEAEVAYRQALRFRPNMADVHYNL